MKQATRQIIGAALDLDDTVAPDHRARVLDCLAPIPHYHWVAEPVAATMLGISKAHLGNWRRGAGPGPAEPFPFTTYVIPGGGAVRYDNVELIVWIARRVTPAPSAKEVAP